MTPMDEKSLRLKEQRRKEAIDLAMQARWQEAAAVNEEIIRQYPADIETYNRLGRAYMELGSFTKAKEAYNQTVKLDPYNAIANRNLRRLNDLKETQKALVETDRVDPEQFIEEIGKAGVVTLVDLAPKEQRALTVAGDKAVIKVDGPYLTVENIHGDYLGKVDYKQALRLIRLMMGGNKYSAVVIKSSADGMTLMVRETYKDPSQAGKLSFPPKGLQELRNNTNDRLPKEESDDEDDSGYTIIGGDEVEVLPDEDDGDEDDTGNDDD